MANTNTLTQVIPLLLAQGLLALRQMALLPRYVNRGFETLAGEKGAVVQVPIPSAITAVAVAPSNTPPDDLGVQPTSVNITLNQWWEAPFFLSDRDLLESMSGVIPMQASEAVKSIANKIDALLIAQAELNFPNFTGVAGVTPFANDLSEFLNADQILNDNLGPADNRYQAISSKAKANAMGLRAFQDASFSGGNTQGLIKGEIGDKLGAFWFMDQNLTRHTSGTVSTSATPYTANGVNALGAVTISVTGGALGTVLAGDKISFPALSSQTYVVASSVGGSTVTSIVIQPTIGPNGASGLQVATAGGETLFVAASHRMNLNFHRDALALASRPFSGADPLGLGFFQSAVDPISGLALRLEVTRQHKRTRFSYDMLCGVGSPRPQMGTVIAGE